MPLKVDPIPTKIKTSSILVFQQDSIVESQRPSGTTVQVLRGASKQLLQERESREQRPHTAGAAFFSGQSASSSQEALRNGRVAEQDEGYCLVYFFFFEAY